MIIVLLILGGLAWLVGWVWIMVMAFSESVPWGVGCFCFPILAVVYGILHWEDAKVPTILMIIGGVASVIGQVLQMT